jgi:hypothetical protein
MKKIPLIVVAVLAGLAALNTRLGVSRDCACERECWCKKPVLRHYRWIVPPPLHKVAPPAAET